MLRRIAFAFACVLAFVHTSLIAAPPTTRPVSFNGLVTDRDGKPIERAEIVVFGHHPDGATGELVSRELARTATDAGGRFHVSNATLPGGDRISVRAAADGFSYGHQFGLVLHGVLDFIDYADRGATKEPWLVLMPPVTLRGVVVDEAGKPVAGAMVYEHSEREPARTDANGKFSFDRMRPRGDDPYEAFDRDLTVRADGFVTDQFKEAYSSDDVVLHVRRGVQLSGRFTDESGKPVVRGAVTCEGSMGSEDSYRARTDADGRYAIRVPAGTIKMRVFPPVQSEQRSARPLVAVEFAREVKLESGHDANDVDFAFRRAVKGSGRLHFSAAPTTLPTVQICRSENGRRIDCGLPATVGRDGKFEYDKLAAGEYLLTVALPAPTSATIAEKKFTVEKWEDFEGLDVEVDVPAMSSIAKQKEKRRLAGKVVDAEGRPVPLAYVELRGEWPDGTYRSSDRNVKGVRTQLDGSFKIELLSADCTNVMLRALDGRREFGTIQNFTRDRNDDSPLMVKLDQRTSRLTGTVRDNNDKPVSDIQVMLATEVKSPNGGSSHGNLGATRTDDKGHYEITGYLPPPTGHTFVLTATESSAKMQQSRRGSSIGIYRRFPMQPGVTLSGLDFLYCPAGNPQEITKLTPTNRDLAEP